MASRGTIETFDPRNPQAWTTYEERLEFYMETQKIVADEEKKDPFFSAHAAQPYTRS